jgi:hypothetical protein
MIPIASLIAGTNSTLHALASAFGRPSQLRRIVDEATISHLIPECYILSGVAGVEMYGSNWQA